MTTTTKTISIYRTVGFTGSTYTDGSREVGWLGEFFTTSDEAADAGCGSNGMDDGTEVREYTIEDHPTEWVVCVGGELGSIALHDTVIAAAIRLGIATYQGLL